MLFGPNGQPVSGYIAPTRNDLTEERVTRCVGGVRLSPLLHVG